MKLQHWGKKKPPKLTKEQMAYVFEEQDRGVSQYALATELKVAEKTLRTYIAKCKELGFDFWKPVYKFKRVD